MNAFDKINSLKENFEENIKDVNNFNSSKGLLKDFGNYLEKNKGLLIGLIGIALVNIGSQASAPIINQIKSSEITQMQNIDEISYDNALKDFQNNVDLNNGIVNKSFIKQNISKEINETEIENMLSMNSGDNLFLKNPFAKNQTLEIKITDQGNSHLQEESNLKGFQISNENVGVFIDDAEQSISFNVKDFEQFAYNFAEVKNDKEKLDFAKYIVYHEAAHATRRQTAHVDHKTTSQLRHVEIEMHSDISALLMIAKENQNIKDFNRVIDVVIKSNIVQLDSASDHNTGYGLIELKKVMNENPELMQMKKEDISEFAYRFVKEVQNIDFTSHPVVMEMKKEMDKETDLIMEDIKNGKNLEYVNYYFSKSYNKGATGFSVEKFLENGQAKRIERQLSKATADVKKEIKYDDLVGLTYLKNFKEIEKENNPMAWLIVAEKTIKEIEKEVENNPRVSQEIVNLMKSKISIDEINYNVSDIQDLISNANNYKSIKNTGVNFKL